MSKGLRHIWALALLGFLMAGCTAKRFLPEGERYFAGHSVHYDKQEESVPRRWQNKIEDDLRPKKVVKVWWARPGVWLHGVVGEVKKDKGLKHWLKYKLGDEPVYLSGVMIERNERYIESLLRSEGFFTSTVKSEVDSSRREAVVKYWVAQDRAYRYGTVKTCKEPGYICSKMDSLLRESNVVKGNIFSRHEMNQVREQMGDYFRSEGYYYFRPDFIRFQVDSSEGDRQVKVRAGLLPDLPAGVLEVYEIDEVYLDLSGSRDEVRDTIRGPINILLGSHRPFVRPDKIEPFIAVEEKSKYSLADQRITLRQLNRLDIFEFVTMRYASDSLDEQYRLRAEISGAAQKKQSLGVELDVNTTSNNFTGPGINIEYSNRNLLRGAEQLRISGVGRYETQLSGARRGLSSFEVDLRADLLVPRRGGMRRDGKLRGNVPRTKYGLQYRILQQADFYTQSVLGLRYGVEWLSGSSHYHELRFLNVDYLQLLSSSPQLDALLDRSVFFRESFENQFIIGPAYSYSYQPKGQSGQRWRYFFNVGVEFSGNILATTYRAIDGPLEEGGQYTLGGIPFSQFSRAVIDQRITYRINRSSELVFRQNIGAGIAYGNSSTMPFAKQFFVGGAISLRAFQPRAIGPGTYFNPDQIFGSFFDQTGDFLVEFNLEYRFGKGGYVEWALFTDIGNVWLQRSSEDRPGGEFEWNRFYREFAVATGGGIRLDFNILLLRFDLALPARLPYLAENDRWVLGDIQPLSREWRRDNLLFNIAIGYPF